MHVHVSNPPKKRTIGGKIESLSSQRVGHENKHLGVTWFEHFIVPSRMKKCWSKHVLLHLEK